VDAERRLGLFDAVGHRHRVVDVALVDVVPVERVLHACKSLTCTVMWVSFDSCNVSKCGLSTMSDLPARGVRIRSEHITFLKGQC